MAAQIAALESLLRKGLLSVKRDVNKLRRDIMATAREFYDEIKADLDQHNQSLGKVRADVTRLLAKIEEMQNSAGTLTPEDEALWTDIRNLAKAAANDLRAVDDLAPEPPEPTP